MSTAIVKATTKNLQWLDTLTRVCHGEAVEIAAMSLPGIREGLSRARELAEFRKPPLPQIRVSVTKTETGWRLQDRDFKRREPSAEQRQAIEAFAASEMPELFVGGLAALDIEQLLAEIAFATGVQLRAEWAVWHLPGGKADRACWIFRGGV
jgi:hypothetical protein